MKTIVITGANSGIGKALAFKSAKDGMRVVAICRDSEKTNEFFKELVAMSKVKPILITGDLSLSTDIEKIVLELNEKVNHIDILINNAGVYKLKHEKSQEGIEMTMAVNLLGTFRLTQRVINDYSNLKIINITSELFKKGNLNIDEISEPKKYNASKRYNDSKLAIVYYSQFLAEQVGKDHVVVAMHPGVVASNAFRDYPKWVVKGLCMFLEKPENAAQKILKPFIEGTLDNGYYYNQDKKREELIIFVDLKTRDRFIDTLHRKYN